MKNRLICLALSLLFVLSVCLTGCADKTEEEMMENIVQEASANTKTLSMWLVVEEVPTDAVKKAVTDAVNKITTSKFNTYMFINFLTEDQYYSTVSDEIRAYEDSKNAFAPADNAQGAEITVGDGQFAKRYPGLRSHQVDIVYIAGEDMYAEYINNGWLSSLDSELSASSKKIKEYISATLLEAAKFEGGTYAIPNNGAIGEYTYMLLDKELMEKNSMHGIYNQGKIDGFFNEYVYDYLEEVRKHDDVLPIDATYDECLELLAHYWAIDPVTYEAAEKQFSVLGYRYTNPKTLSKGKTVLAFNSLFADETFCKNFVKLNEYRLDEGYFGEAAEGEKAAIKFATGDYSDYETFKSEGYYPVIVKYPTVDAEDVFDSMFGVCTYSVDLSASMQIVTYLNTSADLRNLLQYGVEGEHYKVIEDEDGNKSVERLVDENDKLYYSMDLFKTGNAFIAYPEAGMNPEIWEIGKDQNRDALIEPLLNFDFAQIVKDSDASAEESVKVGSKGYVYTYESGYSKDVAAQNALLKKWIDKCDAAGKGVYVLHTGVLSGQNFTGKLYYYNNNITGATVNVTDENGALTVNYNGTAGEGSDLTVITFNGKKNSSNLAWNATVNGAAVNTAVTYQNSLLSFDFFNTEYYTVDFDANVTKGMICENEELWKWISNPETAHANDKANVAVFNATDGTTNAVTKSTYAVYLPKITNGYTVSVQPTVEGTTLKINITYNKNTTALGESDIKYAIFLVNVTMKAPMTDVQYNLVVDGKAVTDAPTQLDTDPKIAISGTLDVELVKYFDAINDKVELLLKGCDDIKSFETVVNDLHILFTPISVENVLKNGVSHIKNTDPSLGQVLFTSDAVKDWISVLDLEEFYWMLSCATSKDKVVHLTFDENDDTGTKTKEVDKNPATGEVYHYYSSPYALYVEWLKANGYTK